MSVYHMYFWFPWRPEEGVDYLELELWVTVSCTIRYWKLNSCLLQE